MLALTDSLEIVIRKILAVVSYIGMIANSFNVFVIVKLKPETSPWKGYNLQRGISFCMRNWPLLFVVDILVLSGLVFP